MKENDTSSCKLTRPQKLALIICFDTFEKYLSNVDKRYDMRKVRTFSVKSS